jgi:hypothetical protein
VNPPRYDQMVDWYCTFCGQTFICKCGKMGRRDLFDRVSMKNHLMGKSKKPTCMTCTEHK